MPRTEYSREPPAFCGAIRPGRIKNLTKYPNASATGSVPMPIPLQKRTYLWIPFCSSPLSGELERPFLWRTAPRVESLRQDLAIKHRIARMRPAAELLENTTASAEPRQSVALGRSRSVLAEHRLKNQPVILCRCAGIGHLSGLHVLDPRPHCVCQHCSVFVHSVTCSCCLKSPVSPI